MKVKAVYWKEKGVSKSITFYNVDSFHFLEYKLILHYKGNPVQQVLNNVTSIYVEEA